MREITIEVESEEEGVAIKEALNDPAFRAVAAIIGIFGSLATRDDRRRAMYTAETFFGIKASR